MGRINVYLSDTLEDEMKANNLSASALLQQAIREELDRTKKLTPRQRLFRALDDLADEIGQVPGMSSKLQRRQAVIDVVNALFPKPNEKMRRPSTTLIITRGN